MTTGEQLLVACLKFKSHKILSVVQKRWLDDSEVTQYNTVMEYYREHGDMMGLKAFCDKFKLDSSEVDSRPTYYLSLVKDRYVFSSLSDNIPRFMRSVKDDPRKVLSELQTLITNLTVDSVDSKDTLYSDDIETRKAEYEERMKSLGVTYLSMGTPDMDSTFYGYRKHDLITIGGKAGQGKTWILVYLAMMLENVLKERAALGDDFGDILFISNEMGEEEIKERIDCLRFRLPYGSFMKGTLTEREKGRYYRGLDSLKKDKSRIRIVYSCQTVDEISTYIGLYKPAAVFIDGSYLMEGKMQEGWEKIAYITRNLKRIAKNSKTPIVNTTQLKRGSSKSSSKVASDGMDDFAYGSSYTQDSDIAIRMFQDADMKFHDLVGCEIVKGRRVVTGTTLIFQNDLTNMLHSITLSADESKTPERIEDY